MTRARGNVATTAGAHVVLQGLVGLHAANLHLAELAVPDAHGSAAGGGPQHEGEHEHERNANHDVVGRASAASAIRVESHALSIVGEMETLVVERAGGVATVTMNRPQKKNAANGAMWRELLETFRGFTDDPSVRAVVVTGAGGEFCSGADLSAPDRGQGQHALARMRTISEVCLALANLPQPTIAKVRGVAVGAGCNLALVCDLVVASETARFSEIFSRRGLSLDFAGSWVLPRRVGLHRAKELAFFAEIVGADEAERIGLVNRVLPDGEVDAFVDDWARRLAAGPPIALRQTKQMLNASLTTTLPDALEAEAAAQAINFTTADTAEAMAAFLEKREPKFTGR